MERVVILHNIRSAHNVGSIFRTADGAGVGTIYLIGHTPTPVDRFGRPQKEIAKTSLGASEFIPWEHHEAVEPVIKNLQEEGVYVVAVEQHEDAIDYKKFKTDKQVAYIFGNEVGGVPDVVCARCDAVIEIPMHGKKESLNVSVSAGVVLFH